ncbi:hypothetical protein [Oryza sativa Japonica Group]|uniref:p0035H10.1 protein n=1 Tax=Oryza sativa subsp. japonica TaxID=39947 RepID=Q9FP38_ORYSJ|nr:P0035H10.1 [Oryza sativa Japonica Group]BAB60951.1 hypothetical protein [Oryza sativa Japonica Group]
MLGARGSGVAARRRRRGTVGLPGARGGRAVALRRRGELEAGAAEWQWRRRRWRRRPRRSRSSAVERERYRDRDRGRERQRRLSLKRCGGGVCGGGGEDRQVMARDDGGVGVGLP